MRDYNPFVEFDLKECIKQEMPIEQLKNKTVLITGSTGLIGSLLTKILLKTNNEKLYNITAIAVARNEKKFNIIFKNYLKNKYLKVYFTDINSELHIEDNIDFIIHGANITDSETFVKRPVETIDSILISTKNILEFARTKKVKSLLYLSSLEIYGTKGWSAKKISETDYGYIDALNIRSSYSEGKKLAECLCYSYQKEYQVPIKIARLSQTFGAGVNYYDNRVFAQFARNLIQQKNIVLHTKGETIRNYCYTTDAIRAIFFILLIGIDGNAYNVANKNSVISIYDMAQLFLKQVPNRDLKIEMQLDSVYEKVYNPIIKVELDTSKLEQLGWKAKVGLDTMISRLIESMAFERKTKG